MKLFLIFSILIPLNLVSCEKILFLLPLGSKSHKNVFEPLIKGMAGRGHDVTVVSAYKPSKETKGIRELVPTNIAQHWKSFGENPFKTRSEGKMAMMMNSFQFIFDSCEEAYQNEEFMELLKEKWDLVYINGFMNECMYGFIHKTKTPFIIVTTMAAPTIITSFTGNRLPPSFVPTLIFDYADSMSFTQRMVNVAFNLVWEVVQKLRFDNKYNAMNQKYFGPEFPQLSEIMSNVSAIFMNSHFTLTYPRPTLPDVLEVGGMHCGPAKPLPKDIEDFVAGAEHGFIFFSLGSVVQGTTLPENIRRIFLNVFSRLKQRVVWKWETGEMADLPSNVRLLKWAPQQDLLGHKNIKMFITHGGLLSTQEAAYHGVPLIGVPIFGDQDMNMAKAERAGYALAVEILTLTEEILETTIQKILNEKQFTENAKELSARFRDQPKTPLETAIFWSEYIIRHKGLARSAARDLNFFQYHSIDVIALLILIVVGVLWIIKLVLTTLCRLIFCRNKNKKVKTN